MNIHAPIRDFLQQQTIRSLVEPGQGEGDYIKAGVIPFLRENPSRYYVMKPRAKLPELGAPPFQICKGTRMQLVPNIGWRDIKEEGMRAPIMESLAETALREGIEELGVRLDNIKALIDIGPFGFSSATTGRSKSMWLFAAEMKNEKDFLPDNSIAETTAERQWMPLSEFTVVGREDHRYILETIQSKL